MSTPERELPAPWPSPPDPGDLSRRLARRRAQLNLSTQQVAFRASISTRYLEYLERYPGRPSAIVLRRLADTLRTSPAALLGCGLDAPPGRGCPAGHRALVRLTRAECYRLIASGGIGRVTVSTASGLAVLPVNFAMVSAAIVFRTGSGSVIAAHGEDPSVSFEVDHLDDALGEGWSVLVQGTARLITGESELRGLRRQPGPRPWPEGDRDAWVCVTPVRISGRRVISVVG